ncbi:MCE family protein [Gandjariella thermophila]|uniref:ABC transporter substrate-binding protein n=1 Tax=Gandjariella thermophila TaxID=1931992 RepID=A0A4D4IZT2_9PSEU|nr:MCE family protein [Gandjariella thermophila]GDY29761.1 ABC transporter substrate-binding protein [Gandjariella thermophila]
MAANTIAARVRERARKPLRDRNQAVVGAVTLAVLIIGVILAFNADKLPVIGGGTSYTAMFTESAGIQPDNEVRIAGVKVGKVTGVGLAGNQVRVTFQVKDAWVGDRSTASIEIKTLLGEKYLSVDPEGGRAQDPDTPIPTSRTRAPFDITDALTQLTQTANQIDTRRLAQSFEAISATFKNTPPEMKSALDGLSALSRTISSRDEQLANLLANTNQVSKIVSDRDAQIQKLIADGNLLLAELQQRKQAIDALLTGTQNLATQLRGLVKDNQAQLTPALQKLDQLTAMLQRNQDNLSRGLQQMAPFIRVFNNTIGNGRWFEGYLCGILPPTTNIGQVFQLNPEGCPPPNYATTTGGGR